jgi:hypothetical protein
LDISTEEANGKKSEALRLGSIPVKRGRGCVYKAEWADFRATAAALAMFAVVGVGVVICQPALPQAVALLISFAATAAGIITGFLLGLPPVPTDSPSGASTPSGDTHLEVIADWLTKVLVGAGLVQLENIPSALRQIADSVHEPEKAYLAPIVSIVVGFGILGFFSGYLATRLFLNGAFRHADVDSVEGRAELRSGLSKKQADKAHDNGTAIDAIAQAGVDVQL